jgi:hypothetical protein
MGLLVGDHAKRVSVHHNLMVHNNHRNPQIKGDTITETVNNVVFNWGQWAVSFTDPERSGASMAHIIGNTFIPGRNSSRRAGCIDIHGSANKGTRVYQHGNRVDGDRPLLTPRRTNKRHLSAKPLFQKSNLDHESADEARQRVLARAGAIWPRHDPVDRRVLEHVRKRKGSIINSQKQVGGWPKYRAGEARQDSDSDGMPDEWEKRHGLSPNRPDNNGDGDNDGYTNLEEFLNGTDPAKKDPGRIVGWTQE